MKIRRIHIANYKNVEKFEGTVGGSSFFLIAGNDAGKTTVARAIFDILTTKFPANPVRFGSDGIASITVTMDDGRVVQASFNQQANLITIDGVAANTRTLKSILGPSGGFDINEFVKATTTKKIEAIEKLIPDFGRLTEQYKKAVEDRRQANAYVQTFGAQIQPYNEELVNQEEIDISDLLAQIKAAEEHNKKIATAKAAHAVQEKYDQYKKKAAEAQAEVQRINAEKRKVAEDAGLPFVIEDDTIKFPDGTTIEDESISTSRKVMLGFDLACLGMQELKYYHIDASVLDNKALDQLLQKAESLGVQLAIERVDYEAQDDQIQLVIAE